MQFSSFFDDKYAWMKEMAILLLFVLVFTFIVKALVKVLHIRFKKRGNVWQDGFVRALYKPLIYYVWFVAIMIGLNSIDKTFFENLHTFITVAGILALSWFFLRWKTHVVEAMSHKSKRKEIAMDPGKINVVGKFATIVIFFFTVLLLLEVTNQSLTTLIAFGGIGGLAIAIASQEVVSNFFAGFMLYLTQPFGIGDWILLTDRNIEGHVEDIGWYMTRIRTFDKRPLYVPNSIFSKIVVMNSSRMSHRQFKETLAIRYADMPVLKKVLHDIKTMLNQHPEVDQVQRIIVHFINFGAYSLDILVDAYIKTTDSEKFTAIKEDILLKLAEILEKNGAEMPSPTTYVEFPEGIPFKR